MAAIGGGCGPVSQVETNSLCYANPFSSCRQGWVPFCPLDPLIRDCRLERAVCLEPRLLPLLNANGWDYDGEPCYALNALLRNPLTLHPSRRSERPFRAFPPPLAKPKRQPPRQPR